MIKEWSDYDYVWLKVGQLFNNVFYDYRAGSAVNKTLLHASHKISFCFTLIFKTSLNYNSFIAAN